MKVSAEGVALLLWGLLPEFPGQPWALGGSGASWTLPPFGEAARCPRTQHKEVTGNPGHPETLQRCSVNKIQNWE